MKKRGKMWDAEKRLKAANSAIIIQLFQVIGKPLIPDRKQTEEAGLASPLSAHQTKQGIRSNTYDIIPREEWEVIEDCHEAIVMPEEWEQVQEIIDRRPTLMKGNACPFYNLFHGLVYCATCGKSMQVRYKKVGRTGKNRFTGEMREPIDKAYYICQTYNRLGKNACTSHKIEARDLHDLAVMQSRADAQESEVRTIKEIRRYAAIEELDESILNRLISKILIGEVKKVDDQKVQEVRIVYNFVGEIPEIAT